MQAIVVTPGSPIAGFLAEKNLEVCFPVFARHKKSSATKGRLHQRIQQNDGLQKMLNRGTPEKALAVAIWHASGDAGGAWNAP